MFKYIIIAFFIYAFLFLLFIFNPMYAFTYLVIGFLLNLLYMKRFNLNIYDKNSIGSTCGNIFGFILRMLLWVYFMIDYLFKRR